MCKTVKYNSLLFPILNREDTDVSTQLHDKSTGPLLITCSLSSV